MADDLKSVLEELESFEPEEIKDDGEEELETDEIGEDTDDDSDSDSDSDSDTDTDDDGESDKIKSLEDKIAELTLLIKSSKGEKKEETIAINAADMEIPDWKDQDLLEEDFDIDELDGKGLNALLNKAASTGFKHAADVVYKQMLRVMPELIKHNVSVQTTVQQSVVDFYHKNPDLAPFKNAVKFVAEELHSNNPDWSITKLFEESGKEARKRLNLDKKPKADNKDKSKTPPNSKPKGQKSRDIPDVKGLEGEIGEMLGSLGR